MLSNVRLAMRLGQLHMHTETEQHTHFSFMCQPGRRDVSCMPKLPLLERSA
jgi:hypothetical protein